MVLLTPHQQYILRALPNEEVPDKEIDLIDFFINFGFCHRKTAEAAFEKAIKKIVKLDKTTDDQIEYIKEVYLDNKFEELFNTDKLNKYWDVTEKTVQKDHIIKRKQQTVAYQLNIPERSPKERRIAANTNRNRIYDLSNAGPSGQSTVAFASIKAKIKTMETPLPELPADVETSIVKNFKKGVHLNSMFNNMLRNIRQKIIVY
ncbi:MAG: hypothetical protein EXX96DRAFT_588514 [Benjaminiella poitrasii]|nr:MAG: hypothetical protein EXX96DRAFT_588514 [Benjaminiella poitrasii]